MTESPQLRPVGEADLTELRELFATSRNTRHCFCMAFCRTPPAFALGWFGGGNRRSFATLTRTSQAPMGLVARVAGRAIGWCACGPRSRYLAATAVGQPLMRMRDPAEDDRVWLLPCLFVHPDHRVPGLALDVIRAAVISADRAGAAAIEAWPLAIGIRDPALTHVGRERIFARLGFSTIDRPTPQRALMRLDLR